MLLMNVTLNYPKGTLIDVRVVRAGVLDNTLKAVYTA